MQYLIQCVRAVAVAVIVVAIAGHDRARAQLPAALSFTADINVDGLPDLYLTYNNVRDVANPYRRNQFYRNAGGGVFVEEAEARGIGVFGGGTHGAAWADFDNDGDYDLTVALTYKTVTEPFLSEPNRIYRNDGGLFVDATPPAMSGYPGASYTRSILAFDMERDGDLDIFAINGDQGTHLSEINEENEFYRNDGGFNFTRITTGAAVSAPAGRARPTPITTATATSTCSPATATATSTSFVTTAASSPPSVHGRPAFTTSRRHRPVSTIAPIRAFRPAISTATAIWI
jgi:FG-GAP-like repeat